MVLKAKYALAHHDHHLLPQLPHSLPSNHSGFLTVLPIHQTCPCLRACTCYFLSETVFSRNLHDLLLFRSLLRYQLLNRILTDDPSKNANPSHTSLFLPWFIFLHNTCHLLIISIIYSFIYFLSPSTRM